MLETKDKGRLLQIIKHCQRIIDKVSDIDKGAFEEDEDIKEIVCFNIFQIGELAKGLTEEFTNRYSKSPWKQIKGMRDRIDHGYDTINIDIVWNTAKDNIKVLKEDCFDI